MSYISEPGFFDRIDNAEEILLREYQDSCIAVLRENKKKGIRCQVLASMVGSGKTVMGAFLLRECWRKEKRGMFIVDRLNLLDQTSAVFDRYGIPHGVIQSGHARYRPGELIQVASIQTLARRGWPDADLIILDECFTGDTLIETPSGLRRIDTIAAGHTVYNACGTGRVSAVSRNETKILIRITLTNGRRLQVTPNHPIFTEHGWRRARELVGMEGVFSREELRALWAGVWCPNTRRQRVQRREADAGICLEQAAILRAILREEIRESDEQSDRKEQNGCYVEANWASPKNPRWKREGSDAGSGNDVSIIEYGMGNGGNYSDENAEGFRISVSLQDRPFESIFPNSGGTGWIQSLRSFASLTRRKEGRLPAQARVAHIETIECRRGIPVFNIRVGNHPSYFAEGALVHNCHVLYKTALKRIEKKDETHIIGLTATPFSKGMGKWYEALVNVTTGNKLTAEGFLVPFKVWAAAEPDMIGAKVVAGEWTDEEASKRSIKIVGDVVKEYRTHGDGRKSIIFGVDVAHCEELQRQFMAAGINVALYTYLTDDEERETMLREFRKPDSAIMGLISVAALSRGFDVPDVGCIIMCRPLKNSFAEFIQILGRGLRSNPGKENCYILDLAGNFMRHYPAMVEFFEEGAQTLDDGKPKPPKPSIPAEKKPKKCPACKFVFGAGAFCPQCGYQFKTRSSVIHEPGSLGAFDGSRALKMDREAKFTLFAELRFICGDRGYNPGWAAHKYRAITGVWPNGMRDVSPQPPRRETLNAVAVLSRHRPQKPDTGRTEAARDVLELDLFA